MWRRKISGHPLRQPLKPPQISGVENLYSLGEEVAHAVTHGLGAVLSIVGLTVLVAKAALYGNAWHIVAASIFGATLVLMYTASTLYHSIPLPRAKRVLRVIDHTPTWGTFRDGGKTLRLSVNGNLEFNHIAPAVQACAAGAGSGRRLQLR